MIIPSLSYFFGIRPHKLTEAGPPIPSGNKNVGNIPLDMDEAWFLVRSLRSYLGGTPMPEPVHQAIGQQIDPKDLARRLLNRVQKLV